MGSYKPHFEGHPDDYFPTTGWDIFWSVTLLILYIGGTLGMTVGFIFWVMSDGVSRYVFIWSIVVVIFIALCLVLIYFGVRNKTMIERRLIREKIKEQQEALAKTKKME